MDFALSEEQQAIFDMAHDFGQSEIAPYARDWEQAGTIPKELWPKIAALGSHTASSNISRARTPWACQEVIYLHRNNPE